MCGCLGDRERVNFRGSRFQTPLGVARFFSSLAPLSEADDISEENRAGRAIFSALTESSRCRLPAWARLIVEPNQWNCGRALSSDNPLHLINPPLKFQRFCSPPVVPPFCLLEFFPSRDPPKTSVSFSVGPREMIFCLRPAPSATALKRPRSLFKFEVGITQFPTEKFEGELSREFPKRK